ncbi:hypothetical protein CRENBAI_017982 [Crenichthys baileyi]|uniref:Uncharacterized protein n=1 Tax=Crenichthys baileyi TaxID=28760 RepID=A0AAV9QU44_9TELE
MYDKPPERLYLGRDSSLTTPPPPAREAPHAFCHQKVGERGRRQTEDRTDAALPGSAPDMQSLISPVTKAILVALFIFAILLILYVILWYICRDVDCDHGI